MLKGKKKEEQMKRIRVLMVCCVIFTWCLAGVAWSAATPGQLNSVAPLVEKVKHSVVNLFTTQVIKGNPLEPFFGPDSPFREFFGDEFFKRFFGDRPMKTQALGSGFIISEDGYIITNNHVVEKATEIKVKLDNGKEYDAKVVGRDPKTDVALIKVTPSKDFPKPARLGDSDQVNVGDWVMAVGNPFGLGHTVTLGIISAKGRVIGAGPYDDFLQTDAAINPGNSGGPLFNMEGEVIGINTAIIAQGQGIGFAIPINLVKTLLPQLKEGKVIRGWLGVMIQDVTPELAKSFNLESQEGVLISDVMENSPAEKAGLKRGDVVTKFNDTLVKDARTLSRLVAQTKPGTKINLTIVRAGKTKTVEVPLGEMPETAGAPQELAKPETSYGLALQNLTPELRRHFGIPQGESGVLVTGIEPGSPAEDAGLRPGDLIREVNREKVSSVDEFKNILSKQPKGEGILLLVKRGKNTFYVVIKPNKE